MRPKTYLHTALLWPLFFILYLLFAASLKVSELVVGAVCATLVLLPMYGMKKKIRRLFRLKPAWLIHLLKIPLASLQETWLLWVALWQQLFGGGATGTFLEWRNIGPEDEYASARRSFMTFGVCVTPNSYLVYVDREKRLALVRQLVGKKISEIDRTFLELP